MMKLLIGLPQYQKAPDHSQEMNGFGKRESPSVRGFTPAIYNHGSKKPPTIVGGASLIGFSVLLGLYFWLKFQQVKIRYKNFEIIDYKLRDPSISLRTSYKLLVADNPEKWQRGLMYFRKLEGVDGMIFIFPNKEIQTFWNKNTLMDLDLLWIYHSQMNLLRIYPSKTALTTLQVANQRKMGIDEDKIVGKSFLPSIEKSKKTVIVSSPKEVNKVIELPTVN